MVNDDEYQVNIYKLNVNQKLDKRKILIIILIILSFLCMILTGNYITKIVKEYKVYKQYEAQLNSIQHQEEEKKIKISEEAERQRQERIPKLTEVRKKKHGKYL